MKIKNNLDLNLNELQNAIIANLAVAPTNPKKGQIYLNTVSNTIQYWNGTIWVDLGAILSGKYAEDIAGNGTLKDFTITHNLNTKDVACTFIEIATGKAFLCDWRVATTNTIIVNYGTAPAANEDRVIVTK